MIRIYEIEPYKSLHDKLFDKWETDCCVWINGNGYSTITALLAYDSKTDTYEIYRKTDTYLEHPIAVYKVQEIESIETYA